MFNAKKIIVVLMLICACHGCSCMRHYQRHRWLLPTEVCSQETLDTRTIERSP